MFRYVILCVCASFVLHIPAIAQHIDDENGKTYHYLPDGTKQVKEVFHHVRIMKYGMRDGIKYDTLVYVKHGPYTSYYPNGILESSGYFIYDKRDSLWKFYDSTGVQILTKTYRKGEELP